jgi:hypothetical protein
MSRSRFARPVTPLLQVRSFTWRAELFAHSLVASHRDVIIAPAIWLALLERWSNWTALDTHAKLNATRPGLRPELRVASGEREDYQYNRTR